jgi:hypothetical protein
MRHRLVLTALAVMAALVVAPASALAKKSDQDDIAGQLQRSVPISGKADNGSTFAGRFKVREFAVQSGKLVAIGRLTGDFTGDKGKGKGKAVNQTVTMPAGLFDKLPGVRAAQLASCQILFLTLGPLDLNLLGLRVQLNQVILRITAVRGPGNLLGNLLCAITGLLNPPTGGVRTG